jgi:hypothetical protein
MELSVEQEDNLVAVAVEKMPAVAVAAVMLEAPVLPQNLTCLPTSLNSLFISL